MPTERKNYALAIFIVGLMVSVWVSAYDLSMSQQSNNGRQPTAVIGDLELRSTSVQITGANGTDLSLSFKAVVYNPNPIGATVDLVNYTVYADGHYLASESISHEYVVLPESSQTFVFPITVGWKLAVEALGNYVIGLGHVNWEVKGNAIVDVAGVSLTTPFDFTTG
jgi:LEA14-like dessication related protein